MEEVVARRAAPFVAWSLRRSLGGPDGTWIILRLAERGEWRSDRRALDFARLYSGPRVGGPSHATHQYGRHATGHPGGAPRQAVRRRRRGERRLVRRATRGDL